MTPAWPGRTVTIRFDVAPDEGRALFVSYVVASLLAVTWLTLVHLMPASPLLRPAEPPVIIFDPAPDLRPPSSGESLTRRATRGPQSASPRDAVSVGDAFKATADLVDAGTVLRNVDLTPSGAAAHETTAGKVGMETGVSSRTPGMTRNNGLPLETGRVDKVRGNGVSRQVVTIAAPEVRAPAAGTAVGDASEVGRSARAHIPQLERCYYQEGLTRNPSLAGLVRLAVDVDGGRVTSARILDRTWSGAGAAEAEACLVSAVRGWTLGSSNARIVLPLSFTARAPR